MIQGVTCGNIDGHTVICENNDAQHHVRSAFLMSRVASVFSCPVHVYGCHNETFVICISNQQAVLQFAVVAHLRTHSGTFCLVPIFSVRLCVDVGCVDCMLHCFARSKQHSLWLC